MTPHSDIPHNTSQRTSSAWKNTLVSPTYLALLRLVPFVFAWIAFNQVYYNLEAVFQQPFSLNAINYVFTVLIWGLAFYSVRLWGSTVDKQTRMVIRSLVVFMLMYPVGLLMAEYVPSLRLVRQSTVSIYNGASFVLILLASPAVFRQLRNRLEQVIVLIAILNIAYLLFKFQNAQLSGDAWDPLLGVFDQSTISGTWLSIGTGILLFKRDTIRLPGPVYLVLVMGLSVATLLLGSYLGILLTGLFWGAFIFDTVKSFLLRGMLINFLLAGMVIIALFSEPGEAISRQIVNYRVTGIMNTIRARDTRYMMETSTLTLRWVSTVNGLKELPDALFRGNGLQQRTVHVEYEQGGHVRVRNAVVHNSIIGVWLQAGMLVALSYCWFVVHLVRFLWIRFARTGKKPWAITSVLALVLIVMSVTNTFDTTLVPVLIGLLCLATDRSAQVA